MGAEAIAQAATTDYLWPEAEPLRRQMAPAQPFPADCLGAVLGGAFVAMGQAIQSPDAIRGQSLLAAAALAVQAHADLEVDGRRFPLSLYFATVGESGERKSATDRAAQSPHEQRQRELLGDVVQQQSDYRNELDAWKAARANVLNNRKLDQQARTASLREAGPEPEAPGSPVMLTAEPTYEGLTKALHTGWPSMGLFSDEGGRFLGGHAMQKENQLKTAAGLSELWDGKPISRTRGGDGNSLIYGRRLSLHLMLQPCLIGSLYGNGMLAGQGLLSRMLSAYPASTIGHRPYRSDNLRQQATMNRYTEHCLALLRAPLPLAADNDKELQPRLLTLAPDAQAEWVAFHDATERELRPGGRLEPIKGFAAKAAEHALRLAGVLALFADLDVAAVSRVQVEAGATLMHFYLDEALRLFHATTDCPELAQAEQVLAWGRQQPGRRFGLSMLYQYGPNAIRNKAAATRVLDVLAAHGLARELDGGAEVNGKRYRCAWEVRP